MRQKHRRTFDRDRDAPFQMLQNISWAHLSPITVNDRKYCNLTQLVAKIKNSRCDKMDINLLRQEPSFLARHRNRTVNV